ncbi:DUF6089 family protein [Flavobacteriales bacterium]|nr:DUF6089 family protein [Flavobacteriales bacterium]
MKKIKVIILLLSCLGAKAQVANFYAFFGLGQSYYIGDLNKSSFPRSETINISYKGGVGFNILPEIGVAVHLTKSSLNGSDFFGDLNGNGDRGLSFVSPLTDFGINVKFRNSFGKQGQYLAYFFTGMNRFMFSPTVTKDPDSNINYLPEKGFKKGGVNFPIGFGFGYKFTGNIGLVWESALHVTYTDYIDGISKNGNPNYRDAFVDSHLILVFRFSEWEGSGKKSQKRSKAWSPNKVGKISCPRSW